MLGFKEVKKLLDFILLYYVLGKIEICFLCFKVWNFRYLCFMVDYYFKNNFLY